MQIVWTVLLGLLVFGIMVFVHELGHFLCAKAANVRINEFAIGMGPTILKWGRGETVYSLRALPLGGFVSMEGEDEESSDERSFYRCPVWQRMIILIAGALMNVLLGFVLLLIVVSMKPAIASRTISVFDEAAVSNQAGGLMLEDEILRINGKAVHIGNDISYGLISDQDGLVDFTVLRNGEEVELKSVPFQTYDNNGQQLVILDFKVLPMEKNLLSVTREAFYWTFSIVDLVWGSLINLVTGNFTLNQLSGPVGVVTVIGEAAAVSLDTLLLMVGMITINIGVFNLLPFPALDGGKLVFSLIELIFRKPIPRKVENIVNLVGLGLLLVLMLIVTVNDVIKLFP